MRNEVKSASTFLANLLRLGNCLDNNQLEVFRAHLEESLKRHYQQHWFPENPCKGSGYRCLRINHKMDPIILRAGNSCGLDEASLRQLFPHELTLWIDPREVSYRIGENGSICVLFEASSQPVATPQTAVEHRHPPPPTCKRSFQRSAAWETYLMDPRGNQMYVSS
ncbi:BTG1 [Cordylochernes scorpioides]|uniref:BTG1 n=1 Tax=Cordylochernes scorpioides TaxID=51811 RepID=A0ABY6LIX1_9ARAC|nr:BTG1 [Cordylochernes scorpioides]